MIRVRQLGDVAFGKVCREEEKRMKSFSSPVCKMIFTVICLFVLLTTSPGHTAEGLQKLRVAYAAVTAAFAIPWIAKEAGIFQRHGLDVRTRLHCQWVARRPDVGRREHRHRGDRRPRRRGR